MDGQANENSSAVACISFNRDFATDFTINTKATVLINATDDLAEGKTIEILAIDLHDYKLAICYTYL